MPPTFGHGKICYLEIPATDIARSSRFYQQAFGWRLRTDAVGSVAFDDGVGEVSGLWVTDRPPMRDAGIVISIMVDDADRTVTDIVAAGGEIVRPLDPEAAERIAWFRDPGGNLMGIYQEPTG
jgi:predicted enzyme related to lactoylglutathione lyase